MSRSTAHRGRLRKLFAPAIAVATAGMLLLSGVGAAQAAAPFTTTGSIDSVDFRKDTVESGLLTQLRATWSFPDRPSTPAGFTIDLPADLQGREEKFQLTADGDDTTVIANCEVTATQLECELDPAYVAANPLGLKGNVYFWVRVTTEVTKTTEVVYEIGGHDVTVTVTPPNPWVCTENCELNWDYAKDGWINYDTDRMVWYTHVKAPRGGMDGGLNVTVKDSPDQNQKLIIDDKFNPQLQRANELGVNEFGVEVPVNWEIVPRSDYTVDPDGTVHFTTDQGYYYQVRFMTERLADVTEYSNHVDFWINGYKDGEAETTATVQKGGGTGLGSDVGTFTIVKSVDGAPNLPEDMLFTGTYTVTPPAGDPIVGAWEVRDGGKFVSKEFPRGSTVTLTEDTPTEPANITWTSSFATNGFTLVGSENTDVALKNTATVKVSQFTAKKVFDGSDAAKALVPATTAFQVDYAYEAGVGFEAGSGSLTVLADGTPVTSPDLPVGAVLTFSEVTPAAIDGLTWGEATFSPSTLTIGDGVVGELTLTNTVSTVPTPTPTPTDTPTTTPTPTDSPTSTPTDTPTATPTPTSTLSVTGSGFDMGGSLLLVGLLVGAGVIAVAAARTHRAARR